MVSRYNRNENDLLKVIKEFGDLEDIKEVIKNHFCPNIQGVIMIWWLYFQKKYRDELPDFDWITYDIYFYNKRTALELIKKGK